MNLKKWLTIGTILLFVAVFTFIMWQGHQQPGMPPH